MKRMLVSEDSLYLARIFHASPLMGLALCVCLATIFWCILLTRRQKSSLDKILTGLLGMIAIYEALRVLKEAGVVLFPGMGKLDGWVDFIIASLYLIAALILKVSSNDRNNTKVRLRLVEANEKTMEVGRNASGPIDTATALFDGSPLATFAVDVTGTVLYWNAAAECLFGWSRDETLGQRLPFSGTGPFQDKKGNGIEAAVWCAPIRSSNGSTRGTLTIAADRSVLREAGLDPAQLQGRAQLAVQD
jgi:PAS domain-containing protein